MTTPLLSILICTLPDRRALAADLLTDLDRQITAGGYQEAVELLISDKEGVSIGAKRNALVGAANGHYSAFIDDDDRVADTYISDHMRLLDGDTHLDGIGFYGIMTKDGRNPTKFIHSARFQHWGQRTVGRDIEYLRTLNHWNVVRNEFRKLAPFEDISMGEDHKQSDLMRSLINPVLTIDLTHAPMYFYQVRTGISITTLN